MSEKKTPTTVHAVVYTDYDVFSVEQIYFSKEHAELHVKLAGPKSNLEIIEYEISENAPFTCYRAELRFGRVQLRPNTPVVVTKLPESALGAREGEPLYGDAFGLTAAEAVGKLEQLIAELKSSGA